MDTAACLHAKALCRLSEEAAGGRAAGLQKEIPELVEERGRRGWADASLGAAGARSREPAGPLVHRENLTVCDEVATIWRGPA